jgi:hypothetical protein
MVSSVEGGKQHIVITIGSKGRQKAALFVAPEPKRWAGKPEISNETGVATKIATHCSRQAPSCEDRDIGNTAVVLGQRRCGAVHGPLVNVGTGVGVVCCYSFPVGGVSSAWSVIQAGNKPQLSALKGGNVKVWQH